MNLLSAIQALTVWMFDGGGVLTAAAVVGLGVLPYGTVLVAAVLPLAAGIYLLVTTAWNAGEQAVLHRPALAGG